MLDIERSTAQPRLAYASIEYYALGARGGIRTHTPLRITDFKSVASAISPPGQIYV